MVCGNQSYGYGLGKMYSLKDTGNPGNHNFNRTILRRIMNNEEIYKEVGCFRSKKTKGYCMC